MTDTFDFLDLLGIEFHTLQHFWEKSNVLGTYHDCNNYNGSKRLIEQHNKDIQAFLQVPTSNRTAFKELVCLLYFPWGAIQRREIPVRTMVLIATTPPITRCQGTPAIVLVIAWVTMVPSLDEFSPRI